MALSDKEIDNVIHLLETSNRWPSSGVAYVWCPNDTPWNPAGELKLPVATVLSYHFGALLAYEYWVGDSLRRALTVFFPRETTKVSIIRNTNISGHALHVLNSMLGIARRDALGLLKDLHTRGIDEMRTRPGAWVPDGNVLEELVVPMSSMMTVWEHHEREDGTHIWTGSGEYTPSNISLVRKAVEPYGEFYLHGATEAYGSWEDPRAANEFSYNEVMDMITEAGRRHQEGAEV